MTVTRCDRCGRIFEDYFYTTIKVIRSVSNQRNYDLCQSCEKDLENFLKVPRKGE